MSSAGFKVFKLAPVTSNSTVQYGEGKGSRTINDLHSALQEIKTLLGQALAPSILGNPDEEEAKRFKNEMAQIVNDTSLSPIDRVRLFREAQENFDIFNRKLQQSATAKDNSKHVPDQKNTPFGLDDVMPLERSEERGSELDDMLRGLTKTQIEDGHRKLSTWRAQGVVSWNKHGELVDPLSHSKIPGSSVRDLFHYSTLRNKGSVRVPRGWPVFERLIGVRSEYKGISSDEEEPYASSRLTTQKRGRVKKKTLYTDRALSASPERGIKSFSPRRAMPGTPTSVKKKGKKKKGKGLTRDKLMSFYR